MLLLSLSVFCTWSPYFMTRIDATSESEMKKDIEVRLVTKEWLPKDIKIPPNAGVLDTFSGSIDEAFDVFIKSPVYKFNSRPLGKVMELLTDRQYGYDPSLSTIVIINTKSGTADKGYIKSTVDALALRNFVRMYNVFVIAMPGLQFSMKVTVVTTALGGSGNYYKLAKVIVTSFFQAAINQNLMTTKQINLIGYCYSGQLAGYIGRRIAEKNNKSKIQSILALDPYSMGFSYVNVRHLSARDAEIVHAYHTNSIAFGSLFRRSTVDFVFNNGHIQPGCRKAANLKCSHRRAVLFLLYVIIYKDSFQARACHSYHKFSKCKCKGNKVVSLSYPPTVNTNGKYFIRTAEQKPYGYGAQGAVCKSKRPDFSNKSNRKSKGTYMD